MLHRVETITQTGDQVTDKRADFTYYDDGQFEYVRRYSDPDATTLVATSYYEYDGIGRLTGLTHTYDGDDDGYSWQYDAAGRISSMISPDGNTAFTHDDLDQLTVADHDYQGDEAYDYDDNGNRETVDGTINYTTGDDNRLEDDDTYTYEYDAEGNRTVRYRDDGVPGVSTGDINFTAYAWDHRNRLVAVREYSSYTEYDTQSPDQTVEYTYL